MNKQECDIMNTLASEPFINKEFLLSYPVTHSV